MQAIPLLLRERTGVSVAAPAEAIGPRERDSMLGELRTVLARLRQAGMRPDELQQVIQQELLAKMGTSQGVTNE